MLHAIPTHLIAGSLGAGKTSLIGALLQQKPALERWAVLINEFGQIGLDAALLSGSSDTVALAEIPGGCLCCVSGVPFQVGLTRLLRRSRPDRLIIELSGLGHPLPLLKQLRQPPWDKVLSLTPPVLVIDSQALANGQALPETSQALLSEAGLLLLNKNALLSEVQRAELTQRFAQYPLLWGDARSLSLPALPGYLPLSSRHQSPATHLDPPGTLWLNPSQAICQIQQQAQGWSIGWRWHPSQRFDLAHVERWLAQWPWQRAKLVVRSTLGWHSLNALEQGTAHWQDSAWRSDSRIELIFAKAQPVAQLQAGLESCRVSPDLGTLADPAL